MACIQLAQLYSTKKSRKFFTKLQRVRYKRVTIKVNLLFDLSNTILIFSQLRIKVRTPVCLYYLKQHCRGHYIHNIWYMLDYGMVAGSFIKGRFSIIWSSKNTYDRTKFASSIILIEQNCHENLSHNIVA